MFTGIIEAKGKILQREKRGGDLRLKIGVGKLDMGDVGLGDSIASNGVCLTVVAFDSESFTADVSNETLAYTSIESLAVGASINLEKAMLATNRFGGHIVSGHVDGIGEVVKRSEDARSIRFSIAAPEALAKYIAHKGSITVDGISLTVNAVEANVFELNIVPHTAAETTIGEYQPGTVVNLEVDVVARYLERLLQHGDESQADSGLSKAMLAENGFLKGR